MDHIFKIDENTKQIIYTMGELIFLRRLQGQFASRPVQLTNDYLSSLNAVTLDNIIYFSYISKSGSVCLKNTSAISPVYQLNANENIRFFNPRLTILNKHIILFYVERQFGKADLWEENLNDYFSQSMNSSNESNFDASYKIKYIISPENPSDKKMMELQLKTDYLPKFSTIETDSNLLLCVYGNNELHLFELTQEFRLISHDEINEREKATFNRSLIETKNKLTEKEINVKNLENELERLNAESDNIKKELSIRNAQIESAKSQYNELMDVATKYRDEAAKWRMRLAKK